MPRLTVRTPIESAARPARRAGRLAFTITELLVVMAVIVVLLALLLAGLQTVRKQGDMAKSMKHMSQIFTWMQLYSGESRNVILPSQFNYSDNTYKGKARSAITSGVGEPYRGTWADILWTRFTIGAFPSAVAEVGHNYRYDSPDTAFYNRLNEDFDNPLRSSTNNTRDMNVGLTGVGGGAVQPLPYGTGAQERGLPGYFAANNFFNADAASTTFNGWFGEGQIRLPGKSIYLVDSFAGEIIEDECDPYDFDNAAPPMPASGQVDFRYQGSALMLYLDGHVRPEGQWLDLNDLEQQRGVRIRNLDSNAAPTPCP